MIFNAYGQITSKMCRFLILGEDELPVSKMFAAESDLER